MYPYNFEPKVILIPFATAKETLMDEKLPGPWLIKIEIFLSRFILFSFKKLTILLTRNSLEFSLLRIFFFKKLIIDI